MNKVFIQGVIGGVLIGAGTTALVMSQIYKRVLREEVEAEAQQIRLDYARYYTDHAKVPLEQVFEETVAKIDELDEKPAVKQYNKLVDQVKAHQSEILSEMEYDARVVDPNNPEEVVTTTENVFNHYGNDEPEVEPDRSKPYLISYDQFMDDEPANYDKVTLTYFEEDDSLIEEKDESLIPNADEIVGTEYSSNFGHKSGDKDTVYIRNEQLEVDFEITRDPRSYVEVIIGYTDSEDSPKKPGPRKFKQEE